MALTSQQQDALNLFYKNLRGLAQVSPGALPDDIGYQISALVNGGGGSSLPNGQVGYGNGTGITSSSNLTTDGSGNLIAGSVTTPQIGVSASTDLVFAMNGGTSAADRLTFVAPFAGEGPAIYFGDKTNAYSPYIYSAGGAWIINALTSRIQFAAGGYWEPQADFGASLGSSTNRYIETWCARYAGVEQTIAGASTVALAPSSGETIRLTLNSTSISAGGITIANGYPGEKLVLMVVQDTVARTLTQANFSSSFSFAGGSYTVTASANKVDVLTFAWDNTSSIWRESSRALNQ